tara:strand:+ start:358 stop:792 length:435 start_codon:yes stop_codon:yes gene_type:complete
MDGRPRNFKDVEALQKAWDEYKIDLKAQSNEWIKTQYVGKDGAEVNQAMKVPMTFEGFKRFCRTNYGGVEQYFTNQDDAYTDFLGICRAIKDEIREQQIIGGLLGFYNPSITQRLNGLTDKTQTTFNVSPKILNIDPIGGDENE